MTPIESELTFLPPSFTLVMKRIFPSVFMWNFMKIPKNTKIIGIIAILLLLSIVPITLRLTHEKQNTKQEAAQICSTNLATDTMLLIDKSGSMIQPTSSTDSTTRMQKAKEAANGFIDRMELQSTDPAHFLGLTSISDEAKSVVESPLTSDYTSVKSAVNSMSVSGGTCIECAVKKLNAEFAKDTREEEKNVVILITDGGATRYIGYDPTSNISATQRDAESEKRAMTEIMKGHTNYGIVYYTIGFGTDVKEQFLKDVAANTGGQYFKVPTAADLENVLQQISSVIGQGSISGSVFRDLNNNGILEATDTKIPNIKITLKDSNGQIIQETTTNSSGTYIFSGLCNGNFTIDQEIPPSGQQTLPNNSSYSVSITNGQALKNMDFGNFIESPTPTPYACTQFTPTDTMIVFDRSSSMGSLAGANDTMTRLQRAQESAISFINIMAAQNVTPKHQLGLALFADINKSILAQPLTTDKQLLINQINTVELFPSTCIECGLKIANDEISTKGRNGTKKTVILLTDGGATRYIDYVPPTDENTARIAREKAIAEALRGNDLYNITYYTIGFGSNDHDEVLDTIASSTGGKYYQAPDAAALQAAFEEISVQVGHGSISGMKYNDQNYNGKFDIGESGIPNWTIQLQTSSNTILLTQLTDAEGKFNFTNLCNGSYSVTEIQKQGWIKTQPTEASSAVTITTGQPIKNILFGNAEAKSIKLDMTIFLDGIGNAGDTQNPNESEFSNKTPDHPKREIKVEVLNDSSTVIARTTGSMIYSNAGHFVAEASLTTEIPPGMYSIRLLTPGFLKKKLSNKFQINRIGDISIGKVSLVTGDTNSDNLLNSTDYNAFITCYTGLRGRPKLCTDDFHSRADINDDGRVNEVDYNLFIREAPIQNGT